MIPRLKRSVSCATATPRGSADTVDGPRCPKCEALSIALEQQASELLEAHLPLDNLGPASALAPRAVDLSEPLAGKVRRLSETVVRHQMELAALQSEQDAVHTKLASSNTTREGLEQLLKCTMTSLRLVEWSNSGEAPTEDPEGRIEVWKKRAIAAEETSRSYADYTSMLERDVAMLEQELSVAKESEAARSSAVTNTETLEVQTLKRELKDANHEIKQLTAKVAEGAQLQIQLRKAAASVETLKREIAEIMSETAKRGTEDSAALKEAKSEISRLRSMLSSREIEWAAKVDEAWRTVAESRCAPKVGRETAVLVGKLSEREREVETLQSRLLVSEEQLQLMEKAGLRESTEFNSSSTIAHTDALRDMQKLRETVERLSHDLSNASRRAKCRNDENVCLKVQLSSCLQSMESLRAQLNTAKVTNADLLSKIQKLGQRKQDLTETRGQAGLDSSQSTPYEDLKEGLSRSSATGTTVDESKDNNKLGYPAGLDAPHQSRVIKDSQLFSASTTAIATFVCIYALVIPLSIFNVLRMELPFAWRISVQLFGGVMAILIICRPRVDQ
ncbi:hypothetical protein DFJ73DRAFT_869877 [Zopfochytrium polystomum]|nr:hypothetical protein DFJ73DRAFT_869877 [Zopfochytrium polystomum]